MNQREFSTQKETAMLTHNYFYELTFKDGRTLKGRVTKIFKDSLPKALSQVDFKNGRKILYISVKDAKTTYSVFSQFLPIGWGFPLKNLESLNLIKNGILHLLNMPY